MKTVKGGRVAIITNDKIAPLFPTYKGVREGDPFSPLLFNIAADGIAWLIEKAQEVGIIVGLSLISSKKIVSACSMLMILFFSCKIT
jgi:hypothetical protein